MIEAPCPTITAVSRDLPGGADVTVWQVAECFRDAPELYFGQPWEFAGIQNASPSPGTAKLAWDPRRGCLGVFFMLMDEDIFTRAEPGQDNQLLWSLGDSAELFLGLAGDPVYHEYQVAPGGQVLRLRFPGPATRPRQWPEDLAEYQLPAQPAENIRVYLMPEVQHWYVYMCLPLGALTATKPRSGQRWELNLCRYDHTRATGGSENPDPEPVLSSVAPLRQRNFHLREDWLTLVLG